MPSCPFSVTSILPQSSGSPWVPVITQASKSSSLNNFRHTLDIDAVKARESITVARKRAWPSHMKIGILVLEHGLRTRCSRPSRSRRYVGWHTFPPSKSFSKTKKFTDLFSHVVGNLQHPGQSLPGNGKSESPSKRSRRIVWACHNQGLVKSNGCP